MNKACVAFRGSKRNAIGITAGTPDAATRPSWVAADEACAVVVFVVVAVAAGLFAATAACKGAAAAATALEGEGACATAMPAGLEACDVGAAAGLDDEA